MIRAVRRLFSIPFALILVAPGCAPDSTASFPAGTFTSVSSGAFYTCGLLTEGIAFCWGDNNAGQIGNGDYKLRDSLPRAVAGLILFTAIDGNWGHTCGIRIGGAAYCWGGSTDGALGNDSTPNSPTPFAVSGGLSFKAITVGWTHSCGLTNQGAGYCWGNNDFGKLGADMVGAASSVPVPVAGGHVFRSISAGQNHSCAIDTGNTAFCWGWNSSGALGTGDSASRNTPVPVVGALKFTAVEVGYTHTCGVTTAGDLYCWGSNAFGELGDSTFAPAVAPVKINSTRRFRFVSVGGNHSCALDANGGLYCWGNNGSGQLAGTATATCTIGLSDTVPCANAPIVSAAGLSFSAISAGAFHTCAIGLAGGAYCWGANDYAQIGNGSAGAPVTAPFHLVDPSID